MTLACGLIQPYLFKLSKVVNQSEIEIALLHTLLRMSGASR